MTKRLVLDFDGVMIDSRRESMLNSYNTATKSLVASPSALPSNFEALFEANRSYVRSPGEMVCLAKWCIENLSIKSCTMSQNEFDLLYSSWDGLQVLGQSFFDQRAKLSQSMGSEWLNLNKPFALIWQWLQKLSTDFSIITHKNKSAVLQLTEHFGLIVDSDHIYSGDNHGHKIDHFKALHKKHNCSQYFFIDDNLRNLLELKEQMPNEIKVDLILASWGFCTSADQQSARKADILVLEEREFIEFMNERGVR